MKKVFLILNIILFCIFISGFSQNPKKSKLDSLLSKLDEHRMDDTGKVILLYTIAWQYYITDPEKGIQYGKEGIDLAEQLNFQKGLVLSLICTGICYWAKSDYPHSLAYLLRALDISEKAGNKSGISKSSANLGNIYAEQENYPKAMEYYNIALKTAKELKDTLGIARQLGNIGTICMEQEDYPKALGFFLESLKNYEVTGEKRGITVTLANIGSVFFGQSKLKSALDFFGRSLAMAKETGETRWIMYDYVNIGGVYFKMATDTSENYRKEMNLLTDAQKETYLKSSVEYYKKAIEIATEINATKELINQYLRLSNSYKRMGNWQEAYHYILLGQKVKDTVFKQENLIKIANLEAKRENEVKEKEIQLQKVRLEKATVQRIALAGGVLALFIIVLIIYLSRRKSEQLLLNILPAKIARRLKKKEKPIADRFDNAAVVFLDIVGFTTFSKDKNPQYLVEMLTDFFKRIDELSVKHGMEKIKTIGDGYMAVCGLPEPNPESVENAARFALEVREIMSSYKTRDGRDIRVRIGIDAGEVVAGVIGEKRFSYDLWGDTVNTASRMESQGISGEIQITESVVRKLSGKFTATERGEVEVKGIGAIRTWLLTGS